MFSLRDAKIIYFYKNCSFFIKDLYKTNGQLLCQEIGILQNHFQLIDRDLILIHKPTVIMHIWKHT